jgi:hypothetical protein
MKLGRMALFFTLSACVLGGAIALIAETPTAANPAPTSTASAALKSADGKVISTSASSLVIETDAGNRLTFNLDATTAEPASLAAGDRVTVRYSELVASGNHADSVTLAAAPPSAVAEATLPSPAPAPAADAAVPAAPTSTSDLPRTASRLPLILLVGTLAALVAYGVHLSRERS